MTQLKIKQRVNKPFVGFLTSGVRSLVSKDEF